MSTAPAGGTSGPPVADGLEQVWGPAIPEGRAPRLLGLFAHPDDEVFCVGGTIARCAQAGAVTALATLTRGEAGQIRDAATATRRTLGDVRLAELRAASAALGVGDATCLDLGDGHLTGRSRTELAAVARELIDDFAPDVVVTFGPDGASGHPDHVTSCLATLDAIRSMPRPPRLLHARFPLREQLLLDVIVEWLTSSAQRFVGTPAFGHALRLFADGSSMLGFAADHLDIEWFPAGSFIIEQGEPATSLFCILSGSADIVVEAEDGSMHVRDSTGAGCFIGEDGLATGRPRNAHVIARDDVTCLVLAPQPPDSSAGRGSGAAPTPASASAARESEPAPTEVAEHFSVDVSSTLDRKVAALAAHRSQYALDADLFPRSIVERLLGTEHFTVVDTRVGSPAAGRSVVAEGNRALVGR